MKKLRVFPLVVFPALRPAFARWNDVGTRARIFELRAWFSEFIVSRSVRDENGDTASCKGLFRKILLVRSLTRE
jgi:hypothetical protein